MRRPHLFMNDNGGFRPFLCVVFVEKLGLMVRRRRFRQFRSWRMFSALAGRMRPAIDGQGQCRLRASTIAHPRPLRQVAAADGRSRTSVCRLVFNGCIYNFRELRGRAGTEGLSSFFSDGDTEVILKAWHAWGPDCCVTRFLGMFAFAIHERDTGRVVMARDRFGIKPLYLAEVGGCLALRLFLPCSWSRQAAWTPRSTARPCTTT
jgi:hypothetical protein